MNRKRGLEWLSRLDVILPRRVLTLTPFVFTISSEGSQSIMLSYEPLSWAAVALQFLCSHFKSLWFVLAHSREGCIVNAAVDSVSYVIHQFLHADLFWKSRQVSMYVSVKCRLKNATDYSENSTWGRKNLNYIFSEEINTSTRATTTFEVNKNLFNLCRSFHQFFLQQKQGSWLEKLIFIKTASFQFIFSLCFLWFFTWYFLFLFWRKTGFLIFFVFINTFHWPPWWNDKDDMGSCFAKHSTRYFVNLHNFSRHNSHHNNNTNIITTRVTKMKTKLGQEIVFALE